MHVPPGQADLVPPVDERSRRNTRTVVIVVLMAILGACLVLGVIMAALLFPVFSQARVKGRASACASNLRLVGMAISLYAQDYNDKLPPGNGWSRSIQPYIDSPSVFTCPEAPGVFGYAYNSRLAFIPRSEIVAPELTPMLFDSSAGTPGAADPLTSWAPRHGGGAVVAYADGHVKLEREKPDAGAGLPPSASP